jgi:hypothetical protein
MNPASLSFLFAAVGVLIFLASAVGFVNPGWLVSRVSSAWDRSWSMYAAVGARVLIGVIFILAAPATRFPIAFQIIGYAAIAAAVILLFVGKERIGRLLAWFTKCPRSLMRLWLFLGMAGGGFIVYSAV